MYIQILSLLLFIQTFVACQSTQENTLQLAATFVNSTQQQPKKATSSITDVLFQSTDGGQTWQDISESLPSDKIEYFGVQQGEVVLGNKEGLFRSQMTLSNLVWTQDFSFLDPITDFYPNQAGLYVHSAQNGFFKNIATGIWKPMLSSLRDKQIRTIFEAKDGTVFAGTDNGIFKSIDQGKTWNHVHKDGWVIKMVESYGVLICTNERGILRSTDGGEHWDLMISEGGVGIAAEVIEGGFAAITYNTTSKTRRIRISTDAGKTWQAIDKNLPPHANIASIKKVGSNFFCGHPEGIFRSTDGGKTWELLLPSIGKKVFNLSVLGDVIYALPRNEGC
jgi:photosystem II stability/assembly factor-like uncharacterized protein